MRRAVGALRRDIRFQFLVESFLVAGFGGGLRGACSACSSPRGGHLRRLAHGGHPAGHHPVDRRLGRGGAVLRPLPRHPRQPPRSHRGARPPVSRIPACTLLARPGHRCAFIAARSRCPPTAPAGPARTAARARAPPRPRRAPATSRPSTSASRPRCPPHLAGRTAAPADPGRGHRDLAAPQPGPGARARAGARGGRRPGHRRWRPSSRSCRRRPGAHRSKSPPLTRQEGQGGAGAREHAGLLGALAGRAAAHRHRAAPRLRQQPLRELAGHGGGARGVPLEPAAGRWCSRCCATSPSPRGSSGRPCCGPSSPARRPGKRRGCARC